MDHDFLPAVEDHLTKLKATLDRISRDDNFPTLGAYAKDGSCRA